MSPRRENTDGRLLAAVDLTMAEAVRRCGALIACRPGCIECCIGPFPISALDAERLSRGLAQLSRRDPARAEAVRERAGMSAALPGVIASKTDKPVIGVPVSGKLGGFDSLLSIAQMPKGVPVACVAVDGGENAALLAIRILKIRDLS